MIPGADETLSFALSLRCDEVALLDTHHALLVPCTFTVVITGAGVGVLERAAGEALTIFPLTDSIGAALVDSGSLTASASAGLR